MQPTEPSISPDLVKSPEQIERERIEALGPQDPIARGTFKHSPREYVLLKCGTIIGTTRKATNNKKLRKRWAREARASRILQE